MLKLELFEMFMSLNEDQQRMVLEYLERIHDDHDKKETPAVGATGISVERECKNE